MCPETGHDIEVEAGGHLVDETRRVMAQVSRGVHTHYAYARSSQIYRSIAAYAREAQSVELPWRDLFLGDPIAALAEDGPIIRVTTPFGKEGLEDVRASNTKLAQALEELRVAVVKKNETFEQRMEIELGGAIEATVEILRSWEKHMNEGTKSAGTSGVLKRNSSRLEVGVAMPATSLPSIAHRTTDSCRPFASLLSSMRRNSRVPSQ
jgi:hypothetical protein